MNTAQRRMELLQSMKTTGQVNVSKREETQHSTFKVRFLLAAFLFLTFYMLETKELSFLGITGEKIYETVCENAKGFDFVQDFPYTLDD